MTTLVTGANGFVGSALCARLLKDGVSTRGAVRALQLNQDFESVVVGCISSKTDWSFALRNVQHVVHLAARVHVMSDKSFDPLTEFRCVNVEGTINLARQAAAAGVKRFIYLSSIKVNGESTKAGHPFTATDAPAPEGPYGVSKHEAEQFLWKIANETGMEVVIIRPPLVYGPGVKANFESMIRWLSHRIPLPLAAVTNNRRSLVALDNLVDLIVTCLSHSAAVNRTFLVSDDEDLSTADLIKRIGLAMGKPARLFYVPASFLKFGAIVGNQTGLYQRLCGTLQLDIAQTRQLLDWHPPLSVDEGLRRAANEFHA